MKALLAALVAALTLALPATAGPAWTTSSATDDVASWLAMRKVKVRCLTVEETKSDYVIAIHGASAYVEGWRDRHGDWHPYDYSVFSHGICEAIDAIKAGDASGYTVHDLAWALLVLTHEAGHLRGHRWSADEAKTQCWATRHVGYVAHRLGVTDPVARKMLVSAAVQIHRRLSLAYQLPGCKLPE